MMILIQLWNYGKNQQWRLKNFIPDEYWLENYDNVKNNYLPNSDTYVYEEDGEGLKGFVKFDKKIYSQVDYS